MIIKDNWDPKSEALKLEEHFDPILDRLDPRKNEKVTCSACGTRHFPDEETFFTFYGNVTLGLNGGLIGNHFSKDGKLARVTFLCAKRKCLSGLLQHCEPESSTR